METFENIMFAVTMAVGFIALTVNVKALVGLLKNLSIDKIYAKIGKLYDKVGLEYGTWKLLVIPVHGVTIDSDANVDNIELGTPLYRFVQARTKEMAMATFLCDTDNKYIIVDCWKLERGLPKLNYT